MLPGFYGILPGKRDGRDAGAASYQKMNDTCVRKLMKNMQMGSLVAAMII